MLRYVSVFTLIIALAGPMPARADTLSAQVALNALPAPGGTVTALAIPIGDIGQTSFTLGSGTGAASVGVSAPSDQGVVQGSDSGLYAAPITDAAGDKYAGPYLSTGTGSIDIRFTNAAQRFLALLWGSVDTTNEFNTGTGPNLITFKRAGATVATFSGDDLAADAHASLNGSQGYGGSYYVLLNDTSGAFDEVVLSSGIVSFESAEYEVSTGNFAVPVPEPASLGLAGIGLLGLAFARRRGADRA